MTLAGSSLVTVLGKGGVGRTTVAAALGLAATSAGRRALVAEVARNARLFPTFGRDAVALGVEGELAPGLYGVSIDPVQALEEYLEMQLPLGALARRLTSDRGFAQLANAAPGLRELVTMGKLWHLGEEQAGRAAPYDVIIVDLPATGHGLTMLQAPRSFAEIAATGPLHDQATRIAADLADPAKTAAVVVSLAQELPTNEAIELTAALCTAAVMPRLAVVNAVADALMDEDDLALLAPVARGEGSALARAAATAAIARGRSERRRSDEIARLTEATSLPTLVLPELDHVDTAGLGRLAERLTGAWTAA